MRGVISRDRDPAGSSVTVRVITDTHFFVFGCCSLSATDARLINLTADACSSWQEDTGHIISAALTAGQTG
jgi:hypothetical protein